MEPTIIFPVALAGALAILAGIFEDLESDTGSQSNLNSQVQLDVILAPLPLNDTVSKCLNLHFPTGLLP